MVHTRLSSVKKKKYVLPTSDNITNINNGSNDDSTNTINTDSSIKIVHETQTQVVEATQDAQVYIGASEAPTDELADLGDKTANELEKL